MASDTSVRRSITTANAWRAVIAWISNHDPLESSRRSRSATRVEIERLAEGAPHLLLDVGFADVAEQSSPQKRILTGRGFTVELRADGCVTVTDDYAT